MNASVEGTASGGTGDVLSAREALSAQIVAEIRWCGYYLAHLDPQPQQDLIDVRWAAQVAGRTLGRSTRTYASAVGARQPCKITVVVAPTEARTVSEIRGRDRARRTINDLLETHRSLLHNGPTSA